jgi:DNA-binding response OmpR family regulator
MLPDADGLVLTTTLQRLTDAPIIICSARHGLLDRVLGLRLGADDFVAKPFDFEELEARIETVLRRARHAQRVPPPPDQLRVGELVIAQARGTVTLGGQPVLLTPTEYRLLLVLASHAGELLSREQLAQLVWGYQDVGTSHLIEVHLGRLRLKLRRAAPAASVITTVRGQGYILRR